VECRSTSSQKKNFYEPLGLTSACFKPRQHIPINEVAPTEMEKQFRKQLIRGDVHDPGAAMFGGVAGHAGLFSNAYDIAVIMQMLMNGGEFNGKRFFSKTNRRTVYRLPQQYQPEGLWL
jgi:CubicO group peptidase (beta-lactamase class C family)